MKRYQLCGEKSALVLSNDGEWVRLSDHEKIVDELKKHTTDLIDIVQRRGRLLQRQIDELTEALEEEKNGSET